MSEIIFEVTEDEIDGGYAARALGYGAGPTFEAEKIALYLGDYIQ